MLIQFKKDDIVRHLGLLDLQRTMQRALRRSGLPVRYSNGFNPHMVMSFASALSSGVPGDAEILDVSLTEEVSEEQCLAAMNRVLPPSLSVSRARLVEDTFPKVGAALRQAQYTLTLRGDAAARLIDVMPAFLAEEEIMALRKSKKAETMVNIRPMLHELTVVEDHEDRKVLNVRVSFVEAATLKPELLLNAWSAYAGTEPPSYSLRRTALLGEVNGTAVPLMDM